MVTYFSWNDFDNSVEHIAKKCRFSEFSGIYGIPRGGLCLAVALSYKDIEGAMFFVLFSKINPTWWNTVNLSKKDEWIVFPWENYLNIHGDRNEYIKKRGLI